MKITEIVLPSTGEPELLEQRTRELPALLPGQALVRVEASGVSFAEQQMRLGRYYAQPTFPFVPGYDLVGVVAELAAGEVGHGLHVGQRVAALTLTGGWATHAVLDQADLVPVPAGVDAAAAETVVVNGVTAWRMLHRSARVRSGDTIVVLGAGGGVGSTLVQLAAQHGVRVIGTGSPASHDWLRSIGVLPVDYHDDVAARVRELAPEGVSAVFDHVGGPGIVNSWGMVARGGTLVSYGTLATKDQSGDPRLPVLRLVTRLLLWNLLPNGRSALFFNLWAGKARHPQRFRKELQADLGAVLDLLAAGRIAGQVAATFSLADAAAALRFAEAGGGTGKVIILPPPSSTAAAH